MNPLDYLDSFIVDILALKGPKLLIVFLIVLGYGLQAVPIFPNKYIPRVVLVLGILLSPFILSWPQPGQMPPELRYPDLAAWTQTLMAGFLLAAVSWLLHNKLLKPYIDDKLGAEKKTDSLKTLTQTPEGAKRIEAIVTVESQKPKDTEGTTP